MSFFKCFFGISKANQGEVRTGTGNESWISSYGEVINSIGEDFGISSKGTVFPRIGSTTVVGSDGRLFTSIGDSMSSYVSIRADNISLDCHAIFSTDNEKLFL